MTPDARILLTMTRWHHDDLAGRLLQRMAENQDADEWVVLRFPALADHNLHPDDKREFDAPLWPERLTRKFLESARANSGARMFAAMYQQTPMPDGGNHFKVEWFNKRYQVDGDYYVLGDRRFRKSDCGIFVTCDPAASEKESADHTAIGVWANTPQNDLLLLEVVRERLGLERIVPELLNVCQRWRPGWVAVEATGFQVSIVNEANHTTGMPIVREISHKGKSKLVRATPAVILAESGRLLLPDSADWVKAYLDELVRFTGLNDREDDQVDMTAYAVWEMPSLIVDPSKGVEVEHSSTRPTRESNAEASNLWGRANAGAP